MRTKSRPQFELTIAGRKIRIGGRTLIMGILNVTPDSFSDGGRFHDPELAIAQGVELIRRGADWIDVGGESTRPGAQPVSEEEELRRVLPVIRGLRHKLKDVPISIDTTKAKVAELAIEAGADVVNDISGLRFEPRIADVARVYKTPLILMHTRGRPATMQKEPFARDIWRSLIEGLTTSIRRAVAAGVNRSQLILDPGLGFGKPRRQNYEIIAGLKKLERFKLPILVGASRKSFVKVIVSGEQFDASGAGHSKVRADPPKRLGQSESERKLRLEISTQYSLGDAAFVTAAILGGASIVRVHSPAEILPALRVADAVLAACG
jgi:dihydropteroate synthase